jgi:PadR family transcriptional regulator PadR
MANLQIGVGLDPCRPAPVDKPHSEAVYMEVQHMAAQNDREWKKGSADLLILSLVEDQPRHGYDIGKLIEARSAGALRFHVTSLYPLLYRLEKSGWIQGRWVEKPGQRRRRYYKLTPQGQKALVMQRQSWQDFVEAVGKITGIEYA